MKKHVILLLGLVGMLMIGASLQAKEKVAVIPMSVSKSMSNIVTVAKSGGDFTDPQKALDSITDASENNPYLIVIGPGKYKIEQTLEMKPWVDITGSGREITTLWGEIGGDYEHTSAIIQGNKNTTLSNLGVINNGNQQSSSKYVVGINCDDTFEGAMYLKNVYVWVDEGPEGAIDISAVTLQDESFLHLDNVRVSAHGTGATALLLRGDCNVYVNNSFLWAIGNALDIGSNATRIRNTIIRGDVRHDVNKKQCAEVYDFFLNPINC